MTRSRPLYGQPDLQISRPRASHWAVDGIADHLLKFWNPRMRRTIVAQVEHGGPARLDLPVVKVVEKVRTHDGSKTAAIAG